MNKKTWDDEVREFLDRVRQISIDDFLLCDYGPAIKYARAKGLQVEDLTDEEKRRFVRIKLRNREAGN